jgi:hypothetical protein
VTEAEQAYEREHERARERLRQRDDRDAGSAVSPHAELIRPLASGEAVREYIRGCSAGQLVTIVCPEKAGSERRGVLEPPVVAPPDQQDRSSRAEAVCSRLRGEREGC